MKGKGKIHPSPAPPPAAGADQSRDALAVLALLPAAILAMTAALGNEDKEVLAYILTRSIEAPAAAAEERQHCRRPGDAQHRPVFGCGCFDCYTGYWSRWDCSPDRELIHQVIEAFEEHLASSEKKGGPTARGRRRERKAAEKTKKEKEKEEKKEKERARKKAEKKDEEVEAKRAAELAMVEGAGSIAGEEVIVAKDAVLEPEAREEEEEELVVEAEAVAGERRRGWADVMGIFNSRLWSIWSPGA
ncbi:hypothetical protein Cni_G23214 [Canna indica]|uniref:Uncharacterized protein n=1 Tax=Canna indica TaxID=4628 RepID=A0AAQ3KTL9_9LILI|nr:hypothetical protein Cni_G23214 [Canna indica]